MVVLTSTPKMTKIITLLDYTITIYLINKYISNSGLSSVISDKLSAFIRPTHQSYPFLG